MGEIRVISSFLSLSLSPFFFLFSPKVARKSLVLLSTCCLRVAFNRAWVDERWKRGESSWFFSRGKSRNLILRFYKNSVRISARRPAGLNFNLDTRWQRTTTSFPSFLFHWSDADLLACNQRVRADLVLYPSVFLFFVLYHLLFAKNNEQMTNI